MIMFKDRKLSLIYNRFLDGEYVRFTHNQLDRIGKYLYSDIEYNNVEYTNLFHNGNQVDYEVEHGIYKYVYQLQNERKRYTYWIETLCTDCDTISENQGYVAWYNNNLLVTTTFITACKTCMGEGYTVIEEDTLWNRYTEGIYE